MAVLDGDAFELTSDPKSCAKLLDVSARSVNDFIKPQTSIAAQNSQARRTDPQHPRERLGSSGVIDGAPMAPDGPKRNQAPADRAHTAPSSGATSSTVTTATSTGRLFDLFCPPWDRHDR